MHICFISVGGFLHIGPYLTYFKDAGHEVSFITLSPSPKRGVPTYNTGLGGKYSGTEGQWKYPISMLRARYLVRKLRPDIVHTHYVTSGGLAGLVCGFHPTITTVHGSDLNLNLKSKVWRFLLKAVFKHADCVNTVSRDLREKVNSLGISSGKVRVLNVGVDTDKFSFLSRQKIKKNHPLKMVDTRQLEAAYDHCTIINALAILRSKGAAFQMTFVGGGSLLSSLKKQAEEKNLSDHITFLGGVDNNLLPEILHQHNVYLSASLRDGTSLSLLEAMATGVFPIVSDIRANSDWLENGVDGLLHKVGDADDLANCILKVRDNPEMIVNAAQRNRKKVVEEGERKTNMQRLESIYDELVKNEGK